MDNIELEAIATPGKVRMLPYSNFDQVQPNDITSAANMVLHHAHFYEGYSMCSHSLLLNTCPGTMMFLRVLLRNDEHESIRMENLIRQARASRIAMSPARLIFKEKMIDSLYSVNKLFALTSVHAWKLWFVY